MNSVAGSRFSAPSSRVRPQQQHRNHMERRRPHDLHNVRPAHHSLADMKADKGSREPSSGARAHAAKNSRQKESLDKLAKHMSHRFDADAARVAAVKVSVCGGLARLDVPWICSYATRHTPCCARSVNQRTVT